MKNRTWSFLLGIILSLLGGFLFFWWGGLSFHAGCHFWWFESVPESPVAHIAQIFLMAFFSPSLLIFLPGLFLAKNKK